MQSHAAVIRLDLASGRWADPISSVSVPRSIAITPGSETAFVACDDGTVTLIDTAANEAQASILVGPHRPVEVSRRLKRQQVKPQQQPPQVRLPRVITCPGKNLHDHRLGHRRGPSSAIRSANRTSTGLPVARSNSTQADVSAKITPQLLSDRHHQ
jgi:hypothetical protein